MKKLLGAIALLVCAALPPAHAAESGAPLERAPYRLNDLAALQNGAKLFINHCLNCHSANSVRYSDLRQIGLTDEQISEHLLFTGETVNDMMKIAMTPADAKAWFGTTPPDLSVIARAKSVNAGPSGGDYIYTYMRSFYRDASKLTGWDNLVFPSVAMPHVLWQQQGPRELVMTTVHQKDDGSWERQVRTYDAQGYLTVAAEPVSGHPHASTRAEFKAADARLAQNYDRQMADLAAFMTWMGEPVQQERKRIGMWVLLYLAIFLVVAWRLNAVYWRDVK
ncbi:cytochrome c1 [Verticiella sediminum]|uniref:Cytochrome c1 n=1 Tax=Verticiella sediminum TaxID=1247510 RepID=A0A556A842_9BURK|nr:cytochrome c1 [Verticiella sediminum]TSH89051.1 cytochrome c1 [Verticiella sediminum]